MGTVAENSLASPTVNHIASVLEQRIQSGAYKGGQWLPSERALAEEFQVSRILVRAAVKELERRSLVVCSARCRPLVRGGAGSNGTGTTVARRSLALWIWPHPHWPGSSLVIQGIRHALDHDDFRLVLESAAGENWENVVESEARFLRRIVQDRDIEGVILWYLGGGRNLSDLQALRAANIPVVFLDRRPPAGFEADYVGVDNVRAAEQMMKHLLALGHRRIAHVTNIDPVSTVAERLAGYRRALERAHLPFRPELVQKDLGLAGEKDHGCEAVVAALLRLPEPPTAIFAVNDHVAFRVLTALQSSGLRVPEDMAVAGFDGIERWTPGTPFLTTMLQPFEGIGSHAVELLLERIEAGPAAPVKHIVLNAALAVHDSTRRAPQGGVVGEKEVTNVKSTQHVA